MCESEVQYDSDTDSCEEDVIKNSTQAKSGESKIMSVSKRGQSKLALTLNINQGLLTMYTPVRDSQEKVIPGEQGELILRIENATFFSVSAYKGDVNLGYVCAMAQDLFLNHCGLMTTPPCQTPPPLRSFNSIIPEHCKSTIYRTDPGANVFTSSTEKNMLSVAIRILAAAETQKSKTIRIAAGIRNGTLRHRMCTSQTSWFKQLTDCLNVNDYPIAGYSPQKIVIELNLQLWNSAIDYRPIHLPLRAFATIGSFTIATKITDQTDTTSTLRFIAEDLTLFISNKVSKNINVDLRRNYVCVVDLGLFVLSLISKEKKMSEGSPKIELSASNDYLNVRTCADSARALMDLITYITDDGDMAPNILVPGSGGEEILVGNKSNSNLSNDQVEEQISTLMEEAMQDIVTETAVKACRKSSEGEMHKFFSTYDKYPSFQSEYSSSEATEPSMTHEDEENSVEDFCMLGDEVGVGILPKCQSPRIRMLCNEPIQIIENFFPSLNERPDPFKAPKNFPDPASKYTLREMTLKWQWYGGNDFESSNTIASTHAVTTDEAGQRFDAMSLESFSSSSQVQARESSFDWYRLGGPGRKTELLMELQLQKIRFQHEIFPEDTTQASRQILLVKEIEIRDRVANSQIGMFLYQYSSKDTPKQSQKHMLEIRMLHMRPDPKVNVQEVCLKISAQPLQLNIDQDSLFFLMEFFTKLTDVSKQSQENSSNNVQSSPGSKQVTLTQHLPVMSVDDLDSSSETMDSSNEPLYFRSVVFSPVVVVKLDYQGKHMDFRHGPVMGMLMGLTQLNKSELRLKELHYRHGLLGVERLIRFLLQQWIEDIKSNQLTGLLAGVGPMNSLFQLVQGIQDLFWMPIEQYQKDGRVVRGLKRGANSFTSSTGMALIELTSRVVNAIQSSAETVFDVVSPGPSVREKYRRRRGPINRHNKSADIRDGFRNAYAVVTEGLGDTANQMVRVATEEHHHKGVSGVIGGVLRQIPPTVVQPIIVASEATNNVLGGIQAQLVPDSRTQAIQKWRQDDKEVFCRKK